MSNPASPSDWPRPLYERQLAMLSELAEAGFELVMTIKQQAVSSDDAASGAAAFAKTTRAVRQTLLLQDRVIKRLQDLDAGIVHHRRTRLTRIVERLCEDQGHDPDDATLIAHEAVERLDDEHLLADHPTEQIIARICRDLKLIPDKAVIAEVLAYPKPASLDPPPLGEGDPRRGWRGPSAPETYDGPSPHNSS
ncbi:MAG: hypothetical protein EON94_03695 [Caulobacteraceae bacterium]|nr:MAG: hypothetical protein EON94_03695 [Caulobacteraceae bacterium]